MRAKSTANQQECSLTGLAWHPDVLHTLPNGLVCSWANYYEDADREVREAWNATKHDDETNKFADDSQWAFHRSVRARLAEWAPASMARSVLARSCAGCRPQSLSPSRLASEIRGSVFALPCARACAGQASESFGPLSFGIFCICRNLGPLSLSDL